MNKDHGKTKAVRLSSDMVSTLEQLSSKLNTTHSVLIRYALSETLPLLSNPERLTPEQKARLEGAML